MLPGVYAQNGLDVDGTGSQVLLVLGVGSHGTGELVAERRVGGVGSHVDRLPPGVGSRVGRAGVVGTEDLHQTFALEVLGKPDETRAEHGVGGSQEVKLEGFDGGTGVDDVLGELFGDLGGGGGLRYCQESLPENYLRATHNAVEEEVIVVGHRGVVEDRGHLRALGVLDQQLSGFGVRIGGVYREQS